jgi:hypothetical protein
MPSDEQTAIKARLLDCETRMARQRVEIAHLTNAGTDASFALNLLSAMESMQARRLRRLAALA